MERAKVLLFDAEFEEKDWPIAMKSVSYTMINCSPCRANSENRSPCELFFGIDPDLSNLSIFDFIAHQHAGGSRSYTPTKTRSETLSKNSTEQAANSKELEN